MASMGYTPGGTGGFGYTPTSTQYDPNNVAFSALNNYNQNTNDMSSYLSQMLASNQAAAKKTTDAQAQAQQNAQDTAAAAAPASGAVQGASMGAGFGPWGALIGGIAGTAAGAWKDFNEKNSKPGASTGSSLLSSLGDVANPTGMLNALSGQGAPASTGATAAKTVGSINSSLNKGPAAVPGMNTAGAPGQGQGVGGQGSPGPGWWMDGSGKWNPPYGSQGSNYGLDMSNPASSTYPGAQNYQSPYQGSTGVTGGMPASYWNNG